jgi:palmitoyltransferase
VGFDNRKYFLLFLTYLLIALYISIVVMILVLIRDIGILTSGGNLSIFDFILKIILFIFFLILIGTLTFFAYTHYKFVFYNTTTLDEMILIKKKKDKDYKVGEEDLYEYHINYYYNFTQVFGENPFYWFIPVEEEKALRGRGIYW